MGLRVIKSLYNEERKRDSFYPLRKEDAAGFKDAALGLKMLLCNETQSFLDSDPSFSMGRKNIYRV